MPATKAVFIAENDSGVVPPTSGPDYIETPISSEGVRAASSATQDDLITDSRQPRDVVRTGFECSGPLASRLAYGMHDHILEGALFSADWSNVNGSGTKVASATVQLLTASKTIVATAATPFAGLAVGDWVRLEKVGYANHGIAVRISVWTDSSNIAYDSWTATPTNDGSAVSGVTVRPGQRIVPGNTDREFTYVKKIAQAGATLYECFIGAKFDGLSLQAQPGQIMAFGSQVFARRVVEDFTGSFTIDDDGEIAATGNDIELATYLASAGGGGYTAAPGNKLFSTAQRSGGAVMLDGVPSSIMSTFSMDLQNNIAGEPVLFRQGNAYVEPGQVGIAGNFEAIFADSTLYEKFIADQEARLGLYVVDNSLQGYLFDWPSIRINDGGTQIQGQTGLVKLALSWGATVDVTTSRAMQVIRFGAD